MTILEKTKQLVPEGVDEVSDDFILSSLEAGAIEISNRVLALKPAELPLFSETKTVEDENGVLVSGEIVSVVRENGTKGNYEPCSIVEPTFRFKVTDTESLFYKSKFNPGFYIIQKDKELDHTDTSGTLDDGSFEEGVRLYIVPSPSYEESTTYERGYVTIRKTDYVIDSDSENLLYFPSKYEYLLPLYAAIKIIEHKLNQLTFEDEDQELTETIEKAMESYLTQYTNAFAYMGSTTSAKKGDDDES